MKKIVVWVVFIVFYTMMMAQSVFAADEYLELKIGATSSAASTHPEDIQVIEEYEPSLPDVSTMRLKLKEYSEIVDVKSRNAVSVLYAKGYLENVQAENFNNNITIPADVFDELVLKSFHLSEPMWENYNELTKEKAAEILGVVTEKYLKMYHWTDSQKKSFLNKYSDVKRVDDSVAEMIYSAVKLEAVVPDSDTTIGISKTLTYADAVKAIYNVLLKTDLITLGTGATIGFTEYETEYCESNGTNIVSNEFVDNYAFEALGRTTTQLLAPGDYIKCKNVPESDIVYFRYAIPTHHLKFNSSNNVDVPGDFVAKLGVYVNGKKIANAELSERPLEGQKMNNSNAGNYHIKKYVMAYVHDIELKSGDTFELRVDKDSNAETYYIDSIFFEQKGEIIKQPDGYLSISDYGAIPNDGKDDSDAIAKCVYEAGIKHCGVYFPAGEFILNQQIWIGADVKLQGAGMFHTTIVTTAASKQVIYWQYGGPGCFALGGDNIEARDFRMYNNAWWIRAGSGRGDIGFISRVRRPQGVIIERILFENKQVGTWIQTDGGIVRDCRVYHTFADGIHYDSRTLNSVIQNCYIIGSGDDALTFCGNGSSIGATRCYNNKIINNTARQVYWGRGIMAESTYDEDISGNHIADVCAGAGIFIQSDTAYDSASAFRMNVFDNVLLRCGTSVGRGAISLMSRRAEFYIDADIYDNEIYETIDTEAYEFSEGSGRIYSEFSNNIVQNPINGALWFESTRKLEESVERTENNLIVN